MSAEVCSPIDASLNVVAICDAIVCDESKMLLRDLRAVADDHGHGHRLAERPAEAEDHARR